MAFTNAVCRNLDVCLFCICFGCVLNALLGVSSALSFSGWFGFLLDSIQMLMPSLCNGTAYFPDLLPTILRGKCSEMRQKSVMFMNIEAVH